MPETIGFEEGERVLTWPGLCDALARGHALPRAEIADSFLYRGADTLLNRAAWIDGLGLAVKTATIFPGNDARGIPAVNGGVCLYSDADGRLEAMVDFHLVTKWKTAGDSLLAATRLARPDSRRILVLGAGNVARSLVEAYRSAFPEADFAIWSRTEARARHLAGRLGAAVATDLEAAVREADIVTSATMATEPLIRGDWLRPGQHVDLIGAFRPDMREADDRALQRARVFVDSRETVLGHIGELKIPLASGAIGPEDVLADYYDLAAGRFRREDRDEITLFKNGGGAHLDLMTARHILDSWYGA
ncbi:ornithine cyclodeaminase family protein [Rhodovulum sp. YEN HP10]|uniref:ornithine cyclodeaminase family protein n=1 Tax=Rhodovulum sp. HP10 TaxID=3387397 RepID=UPI0039E18EAC